MSAIPNLCRKRNADSGASTGGKAPLMFPPVDIHADSTRLNYQMFRENVIPPLVPVFTAAMLPSE